MVALGFGVRSVFNYLCYGRNSKKNYLCYGRMKDQIFGVFKELYGVCFQWLTSFKELM